MNEKINTIVMITRISIKVKFFISMCTTVAENDDEASTKVHVVAIILSCRYRC
jgi:hypothetical protein